jgi:hypothetical protein
MDTNHLNAYVNLIEALLQCPKGEEWLLLQQHQESIDSELLTVMAQVTQRLNAEGNTAAAQFLHYWTVQLNHLLEQNATNQTPAQNRAENYLQLIQTLLGCAKGDELAILSQHPDLMDEGLIYTMNQVAAQLAAQGSQDIAIYLKHLAADVNRIWLHPGEGSAPSSAPSPNGRMDTPITRVPTVNELSADEDRSAVATAPTVTLSPPLDRQVEIPIGQEVAAANNRQPDEDRSSVTEAAPTVRSSPPATNYIEELLTNISHRLEQLEVLVSKQSTPPNPLWYMPILERVDRQGWIISSEEVEKLIGIKPHCESGHNFFMRGCWKFVKVGKVGTHSSWRVSKEIATLPDDLTPEPEQAELEPELSSPWSETN